MRFHFHSIINCDENIYQNIGEHIDIFIKEIDRMRAGKVCHIFILTIVSLTLRAAIKRV